MAGVDVFIVLWRGELVIIKKALGIKIILGLMCVIGVIIVLSACGTATEEEIWVWPNYIDRETLFYGETLTIAVRSDGQEGLRMVPFVNAYMRLNPGVNIEFVHFDENIANAREQIAVQMMAGDAPLLFRGHHVHYPNMPNLDMFVDWLPLMEAHPNFDEADWRMNVFEAFALNNRLLGFTPAFQYNYVLANSTVPGLIEALEGRLYITLTELMDLYDYFNNPADNMMFMNGFDFQRFFRGLYIHNFFNFDEGFVNFNNQEFIDIITRMRDLNNPAQWLGHPQQVWIPGNRELDRDWSHRYFFRLATSMPFEQFSIFDEDTIFRNPLLLVTHDSELLIHGGPPETWLLNAGATSVERALATDFILFVAGNESSQMGLGSHFSPASSFSSSPWFPTAAPTNRYLLHQDGPRAFNSMIETFYTPNGWSLAGSREETHEKIFARIYTAVGMPMTRPFYAPWLIADLIDRHLDLFNQGLVTAQQTAENLQNSVTLAMMEAGQ